MISLHKKVACYSPFSESSKWMRSDQNAGIFYMITSCENLDRCCGKVKLNSSIGLLWSYFTTSVQLLGRLGLPDDCPVQLLGHQESGQCATKEILGVMRHDRTRTFHLPLVLVPVSTSSQKARHLSGW